MCCTPYLYIVFFHLILLVNLFDVWIYLFGFGVCAQWNCFGNDDDWWLFVFVSCILSCASLAHSFRLRCRYTSIRRRRLTLRFALVSAHFCLLCCFFLLSVSISFSVHWFGLVIWVSPYYIFFPLEKNIFLNKLRTTESNDDRLNERKIIGMAPVTLFILINVIRIHCARARNSTSTSARAHTRTQRSQSFRKLRASSRHFNFNFSVFHRF